MYKILNEGDFIKEFENYGRTSNFSIPGLKALYEYLTQWESDNDDSEDGRGQRLDVIGICCSFTEFDSFKDFQEENPDIKTFEELYELTTVIRVSENGFIIEDF